MSIEIEVLHRSADQFKVKLIKGQRESYGWEITVQGPILSPVIAQLEIIDKELRGRFLPPAWEAEHDPGARAAPASGVVYGAPTTNPR